MSLSVAIAVDKESFCSENKYECGGGFNMPISEGGEYIDCGICNSDSSCFAHKCYSLDFLGSCFGSGIRSCSDFFPNGKEVCNGVGCNWNENEGNWRESNEVSKYGSCEGGSKSCFELGKYCKYASGCEFENIDLITTQVYFAKKDSGGFFVEKSMEIGIKTEDLDNIEEGEFVLLAILKNSGLDYGIEVAFEIYKEETSKIYGEREIVPIRVNNNALKSFIDANGDAVVEWILTKKDLDKMNYDGSENIYFDVLVDGENLNNIERIGVSNYALYGLRLSTKKGDCIGKIPCKNLPLGDCEDFEGCFLDSGYCKGMGGASCEFLEDENTCKSYYCEWEGYGFWNKITSWFKNLFG